MCYNAHVRLEERSELHQSRPLILTPWGMREWKTRVFPVSFRLHAETCYTHLFHELTRVEKTLAIQGRVYLSLVSIFRNYDFRRVDGRI